MPIKDGEKTFEKIIEVGRNNNYTTGNLLDYEYFPKHYKLIVIDLSKQIELENHDLKQKVNFIGRLKKYEGVTMFFIIEKSVKMVQPLNLKPKSLNQIFTIIQMHIFLH